MEWLGELRSRLLPWPSCGRSQFLSSDTRNWLLATGLRPPRRCGSSVVEHSLGKGEVESSILSRSTSIGPLIIRQSQATGMARKLRGVAPKNLGNFCGVSQ